MKVSATPPADLPMSSEARLALARWHLDRYDRLRASTASRAAVILSASALLSAANALIITQILGDGSRRVPIGLTALCAGVAFGGTVLVLLAVLRAAAVLVTRQGSRDLFTAGSAVPPALVFNGTDTIRRLHSVDEFTAAISTQTMEEAVTAAEIELWFCINQHRARYEKLRSAARALRPAAIAVPVALAVLLIVRLWYHA
ncbi:hypothetical protein GCM10009745_80140 [Kribbella yunnanensis]|uniref:SLATT domain-containing protein n=1 Tax=Kribbella yunnanensis TaxID=190194 RepID=A0ABN2J6S9_9ACTN